MRPDAEGFLQPSVDIDACVRCGKCENVCPVLNQDSPRTPLAVYAAKAKDDELRRISSSGGVFSLLARQVLSKGGVVYGAAFELPSHKVVHKRVVDEAGLDELRGSKYVQSEIRDAYIKVRQDLENGKEVLFSGCPCQIAGLRRYLGSSHKNLLTVEVFCHAVPSPKIWKIFLDAQAKKVGGRVVKVEPRRKCDWRAFEVAIEFETSRGIRLNQNYPIWYAVFFNELCSRLSCYRCIARGGRSGADISVGDFWGVEHVVPDMEDALGVSVVAVNTHEGCRALEQLDEVSLKRAITFAQASRRNKAVLSNETVSRHRNKFMAEVSVENFNSLSHKLTDPPKWFVFLRWLKRRITGVK